MTRKPTGRPRGRPESITLDQHAERVGAVKELARRKTLGLYAAARELGLTSGQYQHSVDRLRAAGRPVP